MMPGASFAAVSARVSAGFTNAKSTLFDGTNDVVTLGNVLSVDLSTTEMTLSCWFKVASLAAQNYLIARARPFVPAINYVLAVNTDGTLFGYFGGVGGFSTSGGSISTGTWYHAVYTVRDILGLKIGSLWLNGIQVGGNVIAGSMLDASAVANIGAGGGAGDPQLPINGNIDEVTIWNAGMTSAQVSALYASGVPTNPTTHSLSANLTHWYRMGDGDTFPTVTDNVGSFNGTCTNMVDAATNFVSVVP